MTIRINGGIITSQIMTGTLRYFKMTAASTTSNSDDPFKYTFSDGTVGIPGQHVVGWNQTSVANSTIIQSDIIVNNLLIGDGYPVAGSVADRAFKVIMEKCNVDQIAIVSDTEIHFSVRNAENWESTTVADTAMTTAVQALGDQGLMSAGPLVIGETYQIAALGLGADFTNVGAASNTVGIVFVATGTTPTTWSTSLLNSRQFPAIPDSTTATFVDSETITTTTVADIIYVGATYDFANITITEVPFELA